MHTSPLSFCTCGSSWKMAPHHTISAVSFDLIGRNEVVVETKRCPQCKMIYGPNFRNRDGQLINTTKISDMALDEVLFINMKVGFTIRFLKYHAYLFFRCCSTGRGVHFAYEQTFSTILLMRPLLSTQSSENSTMMGSSTTWWVWNGKCLANTQA